MIRKKNFLLIALLFPILTLFALTIYKKHILNTGYEVILPISGYDPRDLLSGHYLIYNVDYGINNLCDRSKTIENAYVCFDNKTFSLIPFQSCKVFIHGVCNNGRFIAGIEKYYIPEAFAEALDKKIRAGNASIVISISSKGNAQVKDLLINGKSLQKNNFR